jgi:hypothetical protein
MGIATRQRLVATAVAALLVVGAVLVLLVARWDLTRSNRPSDRRCVDLWNGPANQTIRSLVRGHAFPLATVRGVEPNKAGQPGCVVLLRERQDGRRLLFFTVITETAVIWEGVSGVGTGPTALAAAATTLPTRRCRRTGASHSATASRYGLPRALQALAIDAVVTEGRASPSGQAGAVAARHEHRRCAGRATYMP